MLERFLGKRKATEKNVEGRNSGKPAIDGVAHFDRSSESPEFYASRQDARNDEGYETPGTDEHKFSHEVQFRDEFKDFRTAFNTSNEKRKEKLSDRHSDWKEKGVFDEPEVETLEETNEKHLNANAELDKEGFEDEEYKDAA